GCPVDYEAMDYGYIPGNAQSIYDGWKASPDWSNVAAILGWGSTDSILLAPQVRDDKKPFLSASYFGGLASPNPVVRDVTIPELSASTFQEISFPQHFTSDGFGYNFFAGTDYSTGSRIGMFHVVTQGGKRVGFFYCSADYCKGPIPAARAYAKAQGLLLGRDLTVELTDTQSVYDTKVMQYFMQEKNQAAADSTYKIVDWVWGGNTTKTTAYLAKSLAKMNTALGLNVHLIVNNWGFDENLFGLCGSDCVDTVHGIMPFVAYGDNRAGEMAKVTALHDKWRQMDAATDGNVTYKNVRYVQGYVNVLLFKLAVEKVITSGKSLINGDNIKTALEEFNGVDTGGLTGRLTYSPTDHRPQSTESIYKFNSNGQLVLESQRTITMVDDWLGW
ncbi:MAG TPA: ABC transporter substrate-binding protein, partial [Kofleriaceae bacterium]|nr:ABC transporter substrate-binding protein [Kofleriaceae bacterium]